MAFIKLQFKPGLNRNVTNYSNEGGWYDADKVRFFSGLTTKNRRVGLNKQPKSLTVYAVR